MELKAGYKQTSAGPLPVDWDIAPLGNSLFGRPRYGINAAAVPFSDRLSRYIRITDISSEGHYAPTELVSVDAAGASDYFLGEGDIVFARRGASVGKSYLYRREDGPLVFAGFLIQVRANPDRLLPGYLAAYVATGPYWSWVRLMSMRSGQPGINGTEYAQLPVPRPPVAEQRAIATALSDVDALLGGLDRLITKKHDLKQAAMQQLLTGQTRLPGFHGEWDVVRLGDLAAIISGGTPHTNEPSYWNGGIKWCTPTDITRCAGKYLTETERTISRAGLNSSGSAMLPSGALLLCSRATIGELKIAGTPICTNQGFKSLVCRPQISNEFLYYKLLTMKQQLVERAFGSTFLEISTRNVTALEVATPCHDEQVAIAAILSDMDAELAALGARRDKTRALKQAMMQELLTGKTRLVSAGAAHA